MAIDILALLLGSKKERDIKSLLPILHTINSLESKFLELEDRDFPHQTEMLKNRIKKGESLDSLLPEAFALVREAGRRVLGERLFDVQILGGIILHKGKIVEMKTGEGKTLSSVGAAFLNSLTGDGVHIVTVNDYLAERDSKWMGRIFSFLGLTVGTILSNMDNERRRHEYGCDITYGTNNELGFDYLRDNMTDTARLRVQRKHNYCIIDEIDSILIDEARTPLIISGAAEDDTLKVNEVNRLAAQLVEVKKLEKTGEYPNEDLGEPMDGDYKIDEKNKRISFTSQGINKIEELLLKRGIIKTSIFNEENFEFVHYFTQAVKAQRLFEKDTAYVVQDGLVQIVDEFTGRILHGRRYSDGLHEAIEAKERIRIARRNRTLATITFQNYFRMYDKIAGMTGTADTEASEFAKIYKLDVVVVPSNMRVCRKDENDMVYLDEKEKFEAICNEIAESHKKGQPILVGTVSIDKSEILSTMLTKRGLRHEVLNAKNHAKEASIIAEAGSWGAITIATNMAGRGTDIKLGGNLEFRARKRAGSEAEPETLKKALDQEYKGWFEDYCRVKEAGGLYVIGTERHESRRIDNQLRGRSGRQGDPGRSLFFLSLDDDLMRLFGGPNLKTMMSRMGIKKGEAMYHPLLNRTIENAQKKVEERNFEIRKHLLEYDDVLNQQRKFIYEQRNAILQDQNIIERIRTATQDMVSEFIAGYEERQKDDLVKATSYLKDILKDNFNLLIPYNTESKEIKETKLLQNKILELLAEDLETKLQLVGTEQLCEFIRYQYLHSIDNHWLSHLEGMEALREAVYLRSYAQKNPLVEYKLEGFDIFDKMIFEIRRNIVSRLHLVKIQSQEERQTKPIVRNIATSHSQMQQFGALENEVIPNSATTEASKPEMTTVVRDRPKVGRNEPCPCGSGKKFKHCHGE